jgi:hypothetical protein
LSMMSRKTPVVSWRRCVAHTHSLVNHHQSSIKLLKRRSVWFVVRPYVAGRDRVDLPATLLME